MLLCEEVAFTVGGLLCLQGRCRSLRLAFLRNVLSPSWDQRSLSSLILASTLPFPEQNCEFQARPLTTELTLISF